MKNKYSNLNIIIRYYLVIIILTIYATYKNGILLYNKKLINFVYIFKPLLLILLSLSISYLITFLYKKYIKKEKYSIKSDYNPIFIALIVFCLPININIFYYLIFIVIFNIVKLFLNIKINYYAMMKLIIILAIILLNKYNYQNIYELSIETNLSTFDMFFGKAIGGIATSNILLLIICYIILCTLINYKKEIPLISFVSYFLTLIVFCLIFNQNIIINIKDMICSEFIYAIILIATISFYSPILRNQRIIYSILIGILSFTFNKIFNIYEGVFIAILITSIIFSIINYVKEKKEKK